LPRLWLGHITDGYLASHPAGAPTQILASPRTSHTRETLGEIRSKNVKARHSRYIPTKEKIFERVELMILLDNAQIINDLSFKSGFLFHFVKCTIFSDGDLNNSVLKKYFNMPAFSIGAVIIPPLLPGPPAPIGLIAMNREFKSEFNPSEIEFIFAHEFSHIIFNHSPVIHSGETGHQLITTLIGLLPDDTLNRIIISLLDTIKSNFEIDFKKEFELQADQNACRLVGDIRVGIDTLRKIMRISSCHENSPSHFIFRNGKCIPIVTYGDRIRNLERI
jgi:hypothetical protein